MALTAAEQYELELINRARLDPEAEAARHGISLNEGLAPGTINGDAKQVLAPNASLEAAAQSHSEWMLSADVFSHTGSGGSSAGNRMAAAGYVFTGSWGWSENLSVALSSAPLDLETAIEQQHADLFLSESHRTNTMNGQMREIGIAQVQGQFTYQGVSYGNSSMLTLNFAYSGTTVFVTGVAYDDADNDAFYGIGEGLAGILFTAAGITDGSEAAGGYSVGVTPASAVSVSVTQGSATLATLTMDVSTGNGKLDLVLGANDVWRLELSASATLVSGVANATLLGVADLSLTGHSGANVLTGNKGDNAISGAIGTDSLFGAEGNDVLFGNSGADRLDGGTGTDIMNGGLGDDRYIVDTTSDWVQNEVRYSLGGGFDTVESWASFTLTPNTEMLILQGNANLSGVGRVVAADGLIGNSGNNLLLGQGGDDGLNGNSGNDVLVGGNGRDWLKGGAGADTFVYQTTDESGIGWTERDFVDGFERGADKIDLRDIDANTLAAGDQAFRYIGSAGFSGQGAASAGELRGATWNGGNFILIEMDSNGDGFADMQVCVVGTSTISSDDFWL